MPTVPEGMIKVIGGPTMSGGVIVKITVNGKGGHGSSPHVVKDPITAANALFSNLHVIKSR